MLSNLAALNRAFPIFVADTVVEPPRSSGWADRGHSLLRVLRVVSSDLVDGIF